MKKINFLFGIHNHQPVGNFDSIFEESFNRCYMPFLDVLESHPGIRISLHSSGPLWDFAMKKFPNYISKIAKLVEKKQIELLGGGYYEPLLSIIPERDAVGQIEMMSRFIKKTFGVDVQGIWLTERVWEPHLPAILAEAQIKYTIIDEAHFRLAGLTEKHITGFYLTEKYGKTVAIFPISKQLRYDIPFKLPYETTKLLKEVSSNEPVSMTYADDGEKFGVWPQTYKWVFEEKWLHNFFEEIEKNLSWINMPTFREELENGEPKGVIYLPTASYEEMMEWALPPESANLYKKALKDLEEMGKKEQYSSFMRGGIWNNFLAKYPESSQMYRKMLHVSERLEKLSHKSSDKKELDKAKSCLYQGQCNCSYWHGLFGGLYLNYLRHAIYSNLIEAESTMDKVDHAGHKSWCDVKRVNFLDKKEPEIVIETKHSNLVISPSRDASIIEFDYKPKSFNITNVVSRHEESYHQGIKDIIANSDKDQSNAPKSIHDITTVKDKSIGDKIFFDSCPRYSFKEHFFPLETTLEQVKSNKHTELKEPLCQNAKIESLAFTDNRKSYLAQFKQNLTLKDGERLDIIKSYTINNSSPALSVAYSISNSSDKAIRLLFGIELNLTLLAGNDEKRYYVLRETENQHGSLKLSSLIEQKNANSITLVDEWSKFKINLEQKEPATIWAMPLETVSQSESGYELTYQGSTILMINTLDLAKSEKKDFKITLAIQEM